MTDPTYTPHLDEFPQPPPKSQPRNDSRFQPYPFTVYRRKPLTTPELDLLA